MSVPLHDKLSAERLARMIECSPYGKLMVDAQGTIVFVPVHDEEDSHAAAVIADIAEREKREAQLLKANTRLEEFVDVASHDLKSPLRGIADLVTWIADDLADCPNPVVLENLDRVKTRVQRMETLINELLAYARSGSDATEFELINPKVMIDNLIDFVAPPSGFKISADIRSEPFLAARIPLETVLRNLITNAIKHHDRGNGEIAIAVEPQHGFHQFTVSDDGPGIPEHCRARLFKPFQTLSNAKSDGAGLGLALSKRLVEAHGGRMILEPTDQTRGASFRFWWP